MVLEPPELLGLDACLVAYILNLPYQEEHQLSPIHEEESVAEAPELS